MPDSNNTPREPLPLFGQKDILHDIETVQAKWAREQARRRAIMVKVFIAGGIILSILLGLLFYKIHQIAAFRQALLEEEQNKYKPIGYQNAKIHIISYANDSSLAAEEILREAVDNKPSEFYIEFKSLEGVDGEEVEKALGKFQPGIVINGQYQFTIKDDKGNDKVVKLLDDTGFTYKAHELAAIVNMVHAQIYGESYLRPVHSPKQSIPIEGIDTDSEEEAPPAPKNDHDHDHETEDNEAHEGVLPRTPMNPNELLVPKLDKN